jgi:CRISP-associated protein Cas1
MQLVINTYGAYLKKNGECFVIKNEDKVFELSPRKVESIMITTSAYLSTDAIKLAMDNNIDIVFLDHHGNPYGRVWHSKLGSTTLIRRRQLEISESEQGFDLAKEWVASKVSNQAEFLDRLSRPREDKAEKLKASAGSLKELSRKLGALSGTLDERRGTIMGLEGTAGRIYFELLSHVMPERFRFEGRSRNPAKDEFNAMLNYGYGVLYSLVEKGCILAGLDPYIGFVHTDNYNKKSLVFDLIGKSLPGKSIRTRIETSPPRP